MRKAFRFSLMSMASVLLLLSRPHTGEVAQQKEIQVYQPLHQSLMIVSEKRFMDNGDGTVMDTRQNLMWQKGDNGEEVSFEEAENYCKSLRLGGYADWRLPSPDERDTALVIELMMRRHSRDVYAFFDLYWSSNPTILLPFNYHPSYGKEIQKVYFARGRAKGFVRAVRSLGMAEPGSGK
jgi:hypothetical protein